MSYPSEVQYLFDLWRDRLSHPTAKLTPERARKIQQRLNQGYTVQDCEKAIIGCAHSSFHRGVNDRHKAFDDITLIFRDGSHLESFAAMPQEPEPLPL